MLLQLSAKINWQTMNLGEIRQFLGHFVCDIDAARPCGYNLLELEAEKQAV